MAMPSFTAEASLYKTSEQYAAAGTTRALTGGARIVPQQTGIGCFTRNFSLGPLSLSIRCCAFPPRCCLRGCVVGICRSFCAP